MSKYTVITNLFKYTIGLPFLIISTLTIIIAYPLVYLCDKDITLKDLLEALWILWKMW